MRESEDFSATGPNQKWAGDISYIWTSEGWLYLAVILDLYSRRVIGWAVSNRMKRDLAIRALEMAVALRQPPKGCICYPAGDYNVICREGIIGIAPLTVSKKTVARCLAGVFTRREGGNGIAMPLTRLSETSDKARLQGFHERQRQLL